MKSLAALFACQVALLASEPIRILPLGDSITRGSYLVKHEDGSTFALPHPENGGWRLDLQTKLRAAGFTFDFVGPLNYCASSDPSFDPDHCGLSGFTAAKILDGGVVPTPPDVLKASGVQKIEVPGIATVLDQYRPDVVLLMVGSNGFDAPTVGKLIRAILDGSKCEVFVATIPPQKPPRENWARVEAFNLDLSLVVTRATFDSGRVRLVNVWGSLSKEDILPDGVHPTRGGMAKIADQWFKALMPIIGDRRK